MKISLKRLIVLLVPLMFVLSSAGYTRVYSKARNNYSTDINVNETKRAVMPKSDSLTKKEVLTKMKEIISEILDVKLEDIKMESRFTEDLGADEISTVELVMKLEKEFHITISDKDANTIITVQNLYDYLIKTLKVKN